jgi:hypothetical protein
MHDVDCHFMLTADCFCRRVCLRRDNTAFARGLRAAQVLQDSNVLQIRVDGGTGSLADSRAESARSRQQLREMRARLQEVQSVARSQAIEITALREKLQENCPAEVVHGMESEGLLLGSEHNPVSDQSSECLTTGDPSMLHGVASKKWMNPVTESQCDDDEHRLDEHRLDESPHMNVKPCPNGSEEGNQATQEALTGLAATGSCVASHLGTKSDQCQGAATAVDVEGSCAVIAQESVDKRLQEASPTSLQSNSGSLTSSSNNFGRGRPQSSWNLDSPTATGQQQLSSIDPATFTVNPSFMEKSRPSRAAWLSQALSSSGTQDTVKLCSSSLLMGAFEKPHAATCVPGFINRNAACGAANFKHGSLKSAQQVRFSVCVVVYVAMHCINTVVLPVAGLRF